MSGKPSEEAEPPLEPSLARFLELYAKARAENLTGPERSEMRALAKHLCKAEPHGR